MPLVQGGSKAAIAQNIKTEMHAGRPQKQAIAIAYSTARKSGAKIGVKRSRGKIGVKK